MMAQRNLIAGVILTALGIFYGLLTVGLPHLSLPGTPGPTLFPWLITTGWVVLSSALLLFGMLGVRNQSKETEKRSVPKKPFIVLIAFLAYLPYFRSLVLSYQALSFLLVLCGSMENAIRSKLHLHLSFFPP